MSHKASTLMISLGLCAAILLTGCGPSADMKMQFSQGQTAQYESNMLIIKDFRFEQPNLDKLREEQTKTDILLGFDQSIQSVDADGTATAVITINSLKAQVTNKNEDKFTFDSANQESKSNPMAALIGKSYTIKITPDGKASAVDTKAAKEAVAPGYERRVAESMLDDKSVADRHSIAALPDEMKENLKVNSTWTEVVPSPPGLLAPKNYTKKYVITEIKDDIATVQMTAGESGETAGGTGGSSMGMFAKMFDNEDVYTGTMKFNIATGQVLSSEETLVSTYIAEEKPENGDPAKGPDTLTMRFTNKNRLEKLN